MANAAAAAAAPAHKTVLLLCWWGFAFVFSQACLRFLGREGLGTRNEINSKTLSANHFPVFPPTHTVGFAGISRNYFFLAQLVQLVNTRNGVGGGDEQGFIKCMEGSARATYTTQLRRGGVGLMKVRAQRSSRRKLDMIKSKTTSNSCCCCCCCCTENKQQTSSFSFVFRRARSSPILSLSTR